MKKETEKRKAMTLYLSKEEEMMFRDILSRRPDLPMTKTGIIREALKEYWVKNKVLILPKLDNGSE